MDMMVATGIETAGFRASSLEVAVTTVVKLPEWVMDKTPTHALFTQHYISLAC